jgi:hypothetical protein
MADGAHPMRGDSDVPEDPRGLERAFASTTIDSEAAGPRTIETRGRTNWPVQGKPRPPSQKPMRTWCAALTLAFLVVAYTTINCTVQHKPGLAGSAQASGIRGRSLG